MAGNIKSTIKNIILAIDLALSLLLLGGLGVVLYRLLKEFGSLIGAW